MNRFWVACCAITLIAASTGAGAQVPASRPILAGPASAPAGNADTQGGTIAAEPPPNTEIPTCAEPPRASTGAVPPVSVTVNPATTWQPRGGEVIIAVQGDAALFKGFTVRACIGWSEVGPDKFFTPENLRRFGSAFVRVRPSDMLGVVNLGVVIPNLSDAPVNFVMRWFGGGPSTGFGLVPVADMRLIGYNDAGVLFDVVRPIGITSIRFSLALTVLSILGGVVVLHRLALGVFPASGAEPGGRGMTRGVKVMGALLKFRWVLYLVKDSTGRASLSSFQTLLWSILVAASAIYVMALSGSLIDITSGTLVLLGIAGGAKLLANIQDERQRTAQDGGQGAPQPAAAPAGPVVPQAVQQPEAAAPQPLATPRVPSWMDLLRESENADPDVTRLQMLLFTVVSAAFVALQVLNSNVIPDIPTGYQILMGISNGIYVGKKFTGTPAKPSP
jgi:hypothetical protein